MSKKNRVTYKMIKDYVMERYGFKVHTQYIAEVTSHCASVKLNLQFEYWKEFKIGDLFETYTGGDLILRSVEDGDIPVVTHSAENNSNPVDNEYKIRLFERKCERKKNTFTNAFVYDIITIRGELK